MKNFSFGPASPPLLLDFGPVSLSARNGARGLVLPLERGENGRLTQASRENVAKSLRDLTARNRGGRMDAVCALGARGVSLRRLRLPSASPENALQMLTLQVEKEFPLPPEELAWGYLPANSAAAGNGVETAGGEWAVAAIKRELLDEYEQLLRECGLNPVYTFRTLAGARAVPETDLNGTFGLLNVGPDFSEWVTVEAGTPVSMRVLPWSGRAFQDGAAGGMDSSDSADALASLIKAGWSGTKLYVAGEAVRAEGFAGRLSSLLGPGVTCLALDIPDEPGMSAALAGMQLEQLREDEAKLLMMRPGGQGNVQAAADPISRWKWAAAAAVLVLAVLLSRYTEALVKKPGLARRLQTMKEGRNQLPNFDRELSFLLHLRSNQPPYLDTFWILANASAPGTRLDSVTMNRRGEFGLRATMQNSQQATDLRSKLIDSGQFASVVLEEQTPTPDRQRLVVRLSARWKLKPPGPESSAPNSAEQGNDGPNRLAAPSGRLAPRDTNSKSL